jgi:HD-GYP domain-containing protein (c-di-GMP phosphodiesterase class II)
MRRHPRDGERILCGLEFLARASLVVGQHHERWDGTGYPFGLQGEEIDLNARILAVTDAFDAMISDRVYRSRRSFKEAVEELDRCAGAQFDPAVIAAFHRIPHRGWRELHGGQHTFHLTDRSITRQQEMMRDVRNA